MNRRESGRKSAFPFVEPRKRKRLGRGSGWQATKQAAHSHTPRSTYAPRSPATQRGADPADSNRSDPDPHPRPRRPLTTKAWNGRRHRPAAVRDPAATTAGPVRARRHDLPERQQSRRGNSPGVSAGSRSLPKSTLDQTSLDRDRASETRRKRETRPTGPTDRADRRERGTVTRPPLQTADFAGWPAARWQRRRTASGRSGQLASGRSVQRWSTGGFRCWSILPMLVDRCRILIDPVPGTGRPVVAAWWGPVVAAGGPARPKTRRPKTRRLKTRRLKTVATRPNPAPRSPDPAPPQANRAVPRGRPDPPPSPARRRRTR